MRFHATPPAGLWINDPNALWWDGAAWRLLVQHRPEPGSGRTGWGMAASADLLDWAWQGMVVGGEDGQWGYSGSAIRDAHGIELIHTVHDAETKLQRQARRRFDADGAGAALPIGDSLGTPARNRRDPFVFAVPGGWRLLLAEPCDWHDWRNDPASQLGLFASEDRETWRRIATIGPWSPPGILWEVPVLVPANGRHLLLISTIDRRGDGALCSVRGWVGAFDDAGFRPEAGQPADGRAIDLGPDFYAAMIALDPSPPAGKRPFVAWLSSWATAQEPVWPHFDGGPITLPRRISVDESSRLRIANRPIALPAERFRPTSTLPPSGRGEAMFDGRERFVLHLAGGASEAVIEGDPAAGRLAVRRSGPPAFAWQAEHAQALDCSGDRSMALFVDGPAIELFLEPEGCSVTMVLPGGLDRAVLSVADRPVAIAWSVYSAATPRG